MLGYEINFYSGYDNQNLADSIGPIFTLTEMKEALVDAREHLKEQGAIEFCRNEYWGNDNEGYDFNNCFSSKRIDTLEALDLYIINNLSAIKEEK